MFQPPLGQGQPAHTMFQGPRAPAPPPAAPNGGGHQVFQPPPPGRPGPGIPQPGQTAFFQPASGQTKDDASHQRTMPAPPNAMPGAPAPVFNENIDYNIKIPERLFRLTAGKLAQSSALANSCRVPFGALLRPLAPEGPEEPEVDTVQPGTAGIVRCKRCRTYINAFVTWSDHGRRWRCNICGQTNDCPSAYFCHLDEKGLRRDRFERPELSKGVVEYIAPSEYMVRPPQEPTFFFVLDVSATAVRSGVLASASRAIRACLDDLPGRGRTKIGFITFDNAVHYYNLSSDLSSPQMLVVSDLKQLFVPLPDNLLVNLQESRAVVESFLDNLPDMFTKSPVVSQSCLGSALKAGFTVMKEVGGKMCIFQSIMPNLGDGVLKPREQPGLMGTPNEVKLLRPEVSWYKDTAIEFSRQQISVDMFLFPYQYMDLAALGELTKYSAGSLHSFPSFDLEKDGTRFEERLTKTLTQKTAFESVMRIRCTKGMKITNFYGNFFIRGQDLMALPNCNTESVFGFDLAHDEQNVTSNYVTVQAALLYTSSDSQRRIRVLTQALPVVASTTEVIDSVDTDACCALLAKQALEVALKTGLDKARMRLQQICVEMLRASKGGDTRKVSGYSVPPDQNGGAPEEKPVPENLKLLPLYTLATMKNVAFRGGTDVHPDERIQAHHALNRMFVTDSKHFIYPRMFSIHNMSANAGLSVEEPLGKNASETVAGRNKIMLPPVVNLSVDRLSSDGVYLLDNGVEMYLWVGNSADLNVLGSLFGIHSLDDLDPSQVSRLPEECICCGDIDSDNIMFFCKSHQLQPLTSGDSLANRFGAIVHALREDVADPFVIGSKINVIREGDAYMEPRFFWFMVEDRASFQGGTHSYEEFMEFVNNPNASSGPPGPGGPPGMPAGRPPPPGMPGRAPPPPQPGGMGIAHHGMGMVHPQASMGMAPPPPQPHSGVGMAPPPPQQTAQPPHPPSGTGIHSPPPRHGMGPPPPHQTQPPPPPHGMAAPPPKPMQPPPHSAPPVMSSGLPQSRGPPYGTPPVPAPPSAPGGPPRAGQPAMPPPPGRAVPSAPPPRHAMPPPPRRPHPPPPPR